ncbi:SpoIIE family protein phosphatase [Puerhibacterium sp. TATVAM-FAB25]|uniref:SpoIIE family protein phosphatase n=1 Tax=Puerhibacterium sp. TATVAM-FAB25 TaxID=3093699 RepID=UPI0039795989
MPTRGDLGLLAAFAAAYVVAAVLGRLTVLPDSNVSLVWPAAGVGVLWLLARARRPWPWLDVVVLFGATAAVVAATGASPERAAVGALATVVETVVTCAVMARGCRRVWAGRGTRALPHAELGWFLAAVAAGALASAPLTGLAVWLDSGTWSWEVLLLWCARNGGAVVVVGTVGLVLGAWLRRARTGLPTPGQVRRARPAEWAVVLVLTPVVYVAWFIALGEIVLVFPLIALSVWAGVRLPSPVVTVHNTVVASAVVALTAHGVGPFVGMPSPTSQVAVAQLYVGLACVLALSLALATDDRDRLLRDLSATRDAAQAQAALLTTIVDTMAEGVRVVDAAGRLVVRNPAATRLLLGGTAAGPAADGEDLAGLRRLDGSPLPPEELPFRRALAGEEVTETDLLVRPPAASTSRIVTFTTARLPAASGGGVVTVMRDVTSERQELRRAAAMQASLLPARAPEVPGYELAARFVPARSVGGDFYDWQADGGGLVVTLADVMGKGPAAAILAASTRATLQAHARGADVAGTLAGTEDAMADDLVNAAAFVTAFRAHLDPASGLVTYGDAGHGLSFLLRADGTAERLLALGPPLGVGFGSAREAATVHVGPGDVLLIFSDGVLDAAGGSVDSLRRFEPALRGAGSAREAADAVVALAAAAGPQEDDLTVIALRREPDPTHPTKE